MGPSIILSYTRCLNNPIFSDLGLCDVCWAHFMCHHQLWPTSVSHPFSYPNDSFCPGWRKTLRGNYYPCFQTVFPVFFKIWVLQVASLIHCAILLSSITFISFGLLFVFVFHSMFLKVIVTWFVCYLCDGRWFIRFTLHCLHGPRCLKNAGKLLPPSSLCYHAVLLCVQIIKYIIALWSYSFICILHYLIIIIIMHTYLKVLKF